MLIDHICTYSSLIARGSCAVLATNSVGTTQDQAEIVLLMNNVVREEKLCTSLAIFEFRRC